MREVDPIPGEVLRYRVKSDSGQEPYLVDLVENGGNGECDCTWFQVQWGQELKRRRLGDDHHRILCKHLRRARDYALDQVIQRVVKSDAVAERR